jgi:hypothetical protein
MTTDIVLAGVPAATGEPQVAEGSPVMSIPQYGDYQFDIHFGGLEGQLLRAILAELDLLMAIDGFPTIADLRAAGAQRI